MGRPKAKPCKCGRKHYAKGLCKPCYSKIYNNLKYRSNPEYREKKLKISKEWRKKNPERHRFLIRRWAREQRDKRPKGFKAPANAWVLTNDFKNYLKRLKKRGTHAGGSKTINRAEWRGIKIAKMADEKELKQFFVESVDKVIDGGLELKVAKKLGIEYKPNRKN